jgi:pimeloyl-ACP methyl ester carboxylesterase
VADLLERHHRVIIIDRPGFGHSSRPRGRVWTADAQAGLFLHALRWLGIEQAVVVGHSWGAVAALAMAIKNPAQVAALVVVSGYYFRTLRPDVLLVAVGALPVLGDLLAHTIAPVLGWLQLPLLRWAVFSPAAVPKRFDAEYSPAMAFRPSQIRGTAVEGALMISSAVRNARHYATLAMPVSIISGDGDKVVFPRSAHRLHAQVRGSTLNIVAGAGHMVHHTAPQAIARAVDEVCG